MIGYLEHFPHYRRHTVGIIEELAHRGHTIQIDTHRRNMLVAGRIDAERALWRHGQAPAPERLIMVEHGSGQTYVDRNGEKWDAGGPTPDPNVTLFLAPSQRVADQCASTYPNADRLVVGSPAVERLRRLRSEHIAGRILEEKAPATAFAFTCHWRAPLAGGRNAVPEIGSSWPWSKQVLLAMRLAFGEDVVVHGHPRIQHSTLFTARNLGMRFESEWDRLAVRTKILVADNTSVMWEALTVGIPVVAMSPPEWRLDAPHGFPRFGPDAWPLRLITDPEATKATIEAAIADGEVADPGVYDQTGSPTIRAADAIEAHLAH